VQRRAIFPGFDCPVRGPGINVRLRLVVPLAWW